MELKDMILSTLAELDNNEVNEQPNPPQNSKVVPQEHDKPQEMSQPQELNSEILTEEAIYLKNVKERVLVLFEGLQSPKNDNLETRVDITLNFLEFLLASIEERLEKIK